MASHEHEHIIFYRELSPVQVEALRELTATDERAARLLRWWRGAREGLAEEMADGIADRELFVLFVLWDHGREDVLTADEAARLEQAAPRIRSALRAHEGLRRIASDVRSDAEAFETMWQRWFDAETPRRVERGSKVRRERIPHRQARRRSRVARWGARVGTGAAIVVFAALLLVLARRETARQTVSTAAGETRLVDVGDGSTVRMLGSSRLEFTPPEDATPIDRQVEFEGSGFFDISPADRGFVVKTPNAQAVVLGTSFGVRTRDGATEVILAEGRLTLASRRTPEHVVVLEPGQRSRVEADRVPSAAVDVTLHEELAWTGLFYFRATPIGDILAELARAYDIDLEAAPSLLDEQVTGQFERNLELVEILDVISAAVGARVERQEDGGYRLTTP